MVMKHIALSILATVLLAACTARAGVVTMVLDSPELYGMPGDVLAFSGTLTNTTDADVWLNADNYNLPTGFGPGTIDDSPFFDNTPSGYLAANGTSGDIGLFNITIPSPLADGDYGGTFTILGGADIESQDVLASVDFTVGVRQEANSVPEPGTLPLVGFGALLVWGRVMRGIGRCGAR
jgi:hypothetical protein